GGYVALEGTQLRAVQAEREGSWSRNNDAGGDDVLRRHYATLEAVHAEEDSSYAYVLLPGAEEEDARRAVDEPGAEVVRNDEVAQAVRAGRVLAANFWAAGRVQNLTAQGPACVMMRKAGRTRELSVSDPTHRQDTVTLSLSGAPHLRASDAERVSVTQVRGGLDIPADTSGMGGRPVVVTLAPGEPESPADSPGSRKPACSTPVPAAPLDATGHVTPDSASGSWARPAHVP